MSEKVIKLIGRTTDFQGKTLWEILGNLKNFGVGRYVARNKFQRYPEPSYMKIVKVEAQPVPTESEVSFLFTPYFVVHMNINPSHFRKHAKLKLLWKKHFADEHWKNQ